jgi:misacylated tRNA(Ala) deacylase
MKTELLYLKDCYKRKFSAKVLEVNDKYVILDKTCFYYNSGGQPWDTGTMKRASDGRVFRVVYTGKFSGEISHEVDQEGLKEGDEVMCELDWDRRYLFMRYHTASHVLSGLIFRETGAMITGNQIGEDRTRVDFSLDEFDRELFMGFEEKANRIAGEAHPVRFVFMSRNEALGDPDLVRLARGMSPEIREFRVVDIEGFDKQFCAGTHLRNTSEIGRLRIVGMENKGKNNRRVYFSLE